MTKWVNDSAWNALLGELKKVTRVHVCQGQPTNFADINNRSLGNAAYSITSSFSGTPLRLGLAGVENVSVTKTGTANCVAFVSNDGVLFTTSVTPQPVTLGGKMTIGNSSITAEVL